jgi:hypothetical protein
MFEAHSSYIPLFQDLSLAALLKALQFVTLASEYEKFPGVGVAVKEFLKNSGYAEITSCLS